MQTLHKQTNLLISELNYIKDIFENDELVKENRDYFSYVKQETTPIFDLLESWENKSINYLKEGHKSSIHPKQIVATKENMELLLLHSYYKDLRKRRYMEYYRSCLYVFNQLLKETSL